MVVKGVSSLGFLGAFLLYKPPQIEPFIEKDIYVDEQSVTKDNTIKSLECDSARSDGTESDSSRTEGTDNVKSEGSYNEGFNTYL